MLLYEDRILYGKVETAIPTMQQEGLSHNDNRYHLAVRITHVAATTTGYMGIELHQNLNSQN
jgi:hypothetical protein